MRILSVLFFLNFFHFSFAIDYIFAKNSMIHRDEPRVKSLIYYGQQDNKIYLCSKDVQSAENLNSLIDIFLQSNIKYEFECDSTKVTKSSVLVFFK